MNNNSNVNEIQKLVDVLREYGMIFSKISSYKADLINIENVKNELGKKNRELQDLKREKSEKLRSCLRELAMFEFSHLLPDNNFQLELTDFLWSHPIDSLNIDQEIIQRLETHYYVINYRSKYAEIEVQAARSAVEKAEADAEAARSVIAKAEANATRSVKTAAKAFAMAEIQAARSAIEKAEADAEAARSALVNAETKIAARDYAKAAEAFIAKCKAADAATAKAEAAKNEAEKSAQSIDWTNSTKFESEVLSKVQSNADKAVNRATRAANSATLATKKIAELKATAEVAKDVAEAKAKAAFVAEAQVVAKANNASVTAAAIEADIAHTMASGFKFHQSFFAVRAAATKARRFASEAIRFSTSATKSVRSARSAQSAAEAQSSFVRSAVNSSIRSRDAARNAAEETKAKAREAKAIKNKSNKKKHIDQLVSVATTAAEVASAAVNAAEAAAQAVAAFISIKSDTKIRSATQDEVMAKTRSTQAAATAAQAMETLRTAQAKAKVIAKVIANARANSNQAAVAAAKAGTAMAAAAEAKTEKYIKSLIFIQARWGLDKIFTENTSFVEFATRRSLLEKTIKKVSQNIPDDESELFLQATFSEKLPKKINDLRQHIQNMSLKIKSEEENLKNMSSLLTKTSKIELQIKARCCELFCIKEQIIDIIQSDKKSLLFLSNLNNPELFDTKIKQYLDLVCVGSFTVKFNDDDFDRKQKQRTNKVCNNSELLLPRLIPFPFQKSICFDMKKASSIIINFILRMVLHVPIEQLSISVIDPVELGNSLGELKLLLSHRILFPARRVLTRENEIEEELDQHLKCIENLTQSVFNSYNADWKTYNMNNPNHQLPYKLLIICDFPEAFTDRSIAYLTKLLRHGPQCGVLPLIAANMKKLSQEKRFENFLNEFNKYCCPFTDLFKDSTGLKLEALSLEELPDSVLTQEQYRDIIARISERLSSISKGSNLSKFIDNTPLWQENATEFISASIGRNTGDNAETLLAFGDAPHTIHALLGGKTGSGKSNLLHVLINSLCFKYSPEEFQLYLLDYKDGIEFNFYANPVLPHARLVATQSDVEYGFTVLRHLEEERSRRMEMFKDVSVADYKSYRKKTGNKLPRILVIIDEFQRLFEGDSRSANEIKELLTSLLRLSRAAGIHFLLATQSIRGGLQHMTFVGMLNHLTGRIALSCTQEDSAAILSIGNDAAAELQSPPEAILNNSNGMKSANIRFSVPFAEPEYRQNLLEQLNLCAKKENLELQNTVFQGDILPKVPNSAEFRTACDKLGLSLLLGKKHHFLGENFCTNISRGNLLIAGYDWNLRRGLLHSIFYSLKSLPQKPAILYLNSDEEMILSPSAKIEGPNFVYKDGSWNGLDLNDFITKDGKKIIIIDSFDYARAFHPRGGISMPMSLGRSQGPKSPFELLCEIADPISSIQDVHILLFVEDYERFSSSAKQLLGHFDLRIGFGMDEDQAGRFIKPGSGAKKFPGIENSQKAVFVDCKRNKQFLIRPFILPE